MTVPAPYDKNSGLVEEAVHALTECWLRFNAYWAAVDTAGPAPAPETTLALFELQFAMEGWRERFIGLITRAGLTIDDVLGPAPVEAAS